MFQPFNNSQMFNKDSLEVFSNAASVWNRGLQAIAQETADYSRKSMEKGAEVMEQAMQVKSFDKAVELQQGYARDAYESFVAQATKVGEIYTATAKEAFKPFEANMASFGFRMPK
ncbi:MAG TPA: phasin family protein [Aestuariivirga sp.]|jgi:hypothetical protein|nr:phasin family protein [Aestuariivirga sp.]